MFRCKTMYILILFASLCPASQSASVNVSDQFVTNVQIPADAKDSPFAQEIGVAIKLGHMNLIGGPDFQPAGKVKAKDFISCIMRGISKSGFIAALEPEADDPEALITRQQAVKFLATAIYTPQQIEFIGKQCGEPHLYLSDFPDAEDVASWAKLYYAAAVYKGWVPDKDRLSPNEEITREYAAALLARAFPDPNDFTGLVVYVNSADFKRAQSIQIVSDGLNATPEVLYPDPNSMPSFAFLGAPGIVSYCKSMDEAKERRVGQNPLEVTAADVRKGSAGRTQIVLSANDAMMVWGADATGLFRRTWRVAIVTGQPQEKQETELPSSPTAE